MENAEEGVRLGLKTDPDVVKRQAAWAGLRPGMRVLDVGCGTGITTAALAELVGPNGHATGLDFSEERLEEAREKFAGPNVDFVNHDIRTPFKTSLPYDFVWVRFLLEYFRQEQFQITANCVTSLRIGGIACLADLDNNNLLHHGPLYNDRVRTTIEEILDRVQKYRNFDPFAGRRLYGHLCDLKFTDLKCMVEPHHLVYSHLEDKDAYNWIRKVELTALQCGCTFEAYAGDEFTHYPSRYDAFLDEYRAHLHHPGRFIFTPIMICRGVRTLRVLP
jgi:ubiquinone/menaquinone biosynthesis C-methylase UbiE